MKNKFSPFHILAVSLVFLFLFSLQYAFSQTNQSIPVKIDKTVDSFADQSTILSVDNSNEYISPIHESKFDIWMVGAKISGDFSLADHFSFWIHAGNDRNNLGNWQELTIDDYHFGDNPLFIDPIDLAGKAKYLQYKIVSDHISDLLPKISSVEIIYLDPTSQTKIQPSPIDFLIGKVLGQGKVNIISRKEWGADESIMNWQDDMEHQQAKYFVIHHTATANDSALDTPSIIRAIYYFHTVEKGWGDIGYNYLVDSKGNIYEGRKGGLGVVAAHALGYNYGSIGISLIGDYTQAEPSSAGLSSISDLIAYLSSQGKIDLTKKYTIKGKTISAIIGHRDVNDTECPGDKLYSQLPSIMASAEQNLNEYPADKNYQAKFIGVSDQKISLSNREIKNIKVFYQNTGDSIWQMSTNEITLVPVDPFPRKSQFSAKDWLYDRIVSAASLYSINPGDDAIFNLPLAGAKDSGDYTEKFALKDPNDNILPNTEFSININIK